MYAMDFLSRMLDIPSTTNVQYMFQETLSINAPSTVNLLSIVSYPLSI